MQAFTRILCPTDFSDESFAALRVATVIARWYGAPLTVLHVVAPFPPEGLPGTPAEAVVPPPPFDQAMALARSAVPELMIEGLDVRFVTRPGPVAPAIAHSAADDGTALIVMGTHGRSGFDRLIVGSVTERLLTRATCPVLTIPPHAAGRPPASTFTRVLCGVDYSPASLEALTLGCELAGQSGGGVIVAHVVEWLADEEVRAHAHFNVTEFRQYVVDDARHRLRELVSRLRCAGREVEDVVGVGRAHRELLRLASERHCDLLAVGTQGRGAIGRTLFGSTTQQIVRAAGCPVLVVPPAAGRD